MSYDNVLFAVTLVGMGLCLAYFRAAYRQWRVEKAVDSRRMATGKQLQREASQESASHGKPKCAVLAFKSVCARKARDLQTVESSVGGRTDVDDSRQSSGGSV